jgi:hypothetical protein
MTIDKTGGPAFPSVLFTQEKGPNHHDEGMSLRDSSCMMPAIVVPRGLPPPFPTL